MVPCLPCYGPNLLLGFLPLIGDIFVVVSVSPGKTPPTKDVICFPLFLLEGKFLVAPGSAEVFLDVSSLLPSGVGVGAGLEGGLKIFGILPS